MNDNKEIFEIELEQENHEDYNEAPPADVVAYNELRSCADLKRMYSSGQIDIQPYFQRDEVWNNAMKTRLIDSLIKQLPIPSMCISHDYKTQVRYVIDGLQRISAIVHFLDTEKEWKLSSLDDIDPRISGMTNLEILDKNSTLFSLVENSTLPVTVIRCDYSKNNHMNYLFTIFHRLNTGGVKLSNQEIRNCIFNGKLNNFLRETSSNLYFKEVFGESNNRFSKDELILRFYSFYFDLKNYDGKLAKFLNDFMYKNRNNEEQIEFFESIFLKTIEIIKVELKAKIPLNLNKATAEALIVGILNSIEKYSLEINSNNELISKFNILLDDPLFSKDSLKEGTAQKDKVIKRINRAIKIFS